MIDENPDLAFVHPEEGVNFFIDSMCIPANAKNKEAAEMFINYLCEPDVGLANADFIGYSTPITAVWEMLDDDLKYSEIATRARRFWTRRRSLRRCPMTSTPPWMPSGAR